MRRPESRGFTLLEVLVALLLLALAMVALVRSAGQEAQALVQQREATLAQWIAANVIAETEQRYAGRDWRWQLDVAATDDPGVLRLEVRVHPDDGDVAMPAATLVGFFAP
jgi:general secretion pathway protein I